MGKYVASLALLVAAASCTPLPDRPAYRQTHYIKAEMPTVDARFGSAIAMAADGQTFVVGSSDAPSDVDGSSVPAAGKAHVYIARSGNWHHALDLGATHVGSNFHFGYSVAISADGQTIAVGSPGDTFPALNVNPSLPENPMPLADSGAVYIYRRTDTSWQMSAYIKASNPDAGDRFGTSVALSGDGSILAVGAPGEGNVAHSIGFQFDTGSIVPESQTNNSAPNSGAVYLYENESGGWTPAYYIKAPHTLAGDEFGSCVSLSAAGDILAAGAPRDNAGAQGIDQPRAVVESVDSGAIYTFRYADLFWTSESYFKASNAMENDWFGFSLSVSASGNTLIVGASHRRAGRGAGADPELVDAGAAYVFEFEEGTWTEDAFLAASNADAEDLFGWAVALSPDASTVFVGAPGEGGNSPGVNGNEENNDTAASGAVYAFNRDRRGWVQEAYVKASNPEVDDGFGVAVASSEDGLHFVTGARNESGGYAGIDGIDSDNSRSRSGAVYTFER